jgi:uncharacterized damage-inducible protein DinB
MQVNQAIHDVVQQINFVLAQFEPHEYRQALPEYNGSTIGQHFRHILEFFQCLQQGAEHGLVDYAARQRNLLYEDQPAIAAAAFDAFLEQLDQLTLHTPLRVCAEFGCTERPEYASTLGRELMFAYDHAIHHLAIIKIGLQVHYPHIRADRDLGVSPSTIKARKQQH